MNGRLYDPKLHRFLQPDNYVQDPTNTQNYNRYGYVLNNPLKYIDPSGETGVEILAFLGPMGPTGLIVGGAIMLGSVLYNNWDKWGIKDFFNNNVSDAVKEGTGWIRQQAKSVRDSFVGMFRKSMNAKVINLPQYQVSGSNSINNGFKVFSSGGNINISTNNISDNRPLIVQYNEHAIVPANQVEDYDPTGGLITSFGVGLSVGENKFFNKDTWYSVRKLRTYSQRFNGNGATGGKIASALKYSKGFNYVGKGVGLYNFYSISAQYADNKIGIFQLITEQGSNAYSVFGGLNGAYWSIGWEGGRFISTRDFYKEWKQETWLPLRSEILGY